MTLIGGRALGSRLLLTLLLAVDVVFVGHFFLVSLGRITYPFELEWLEGLMVDYSWRITRGLPIYGPPDASFAADFYPPLFYIVSLPFLVVSGWSLWGVRLVSWLSTVGTCIIGGWVVRRNGGSWAAVVFAIGSAMAFYAPTLHWYDIARVDALETFLVVAGLAALAGTDGRSGPKRLWLAGALLTAAVLTKQTAGLFCIAALCYFAVTRDWRRLKILASAFAVFGVASITALWIWTDGWIAQIYTMPVHHWTSWFGLWKFMTITPLLPLLMLGVAGVHRPVGRIFLIETTAALVVAAISFTKVGGDVNSALPAMFLAAVGAGLAADGVWRTLDSSAPRRAIRAAGIVVLLGAPLWYGALPSNALEWIPSFADRQEARELWNDMQDQPGDFLAYNYSFVSTVLRGKTYANGNFLYDFAGGFDAKTFRRPDLRKYPPEFADAIRTQHYTAIYTNGGGILFDPIETLIHRYYYPMRSFGTVDLSPDGIRWRQVTPRVKWVPKEE